MIMLVKGHLDKLLEFRQGQHSRRYAFRKAESLELIQELLSYEQDYFASILEVDFVIYMTVRSTFAEVIDPIDARIA